MNVDAVIYARKSVEKGADAESKSTALQVEAAKACAQAKGWTLSGVYVDDDISGAETKRLRDRNRLLARIGTPDQPKVILMRDSSRFSRSDGDEAFGELKRLAEAGVQVWFYQDNQPFTHGTFGDNVVGFVRAEMNAEYRRQISRWTHDAKMKKAEQGHLTTAPCFGYDSVPVGKHLERRINPEQAAVIVRIFALRAQGCGIARIARILNQEGALAPKPARAGAKPGWIGVTVHRVLTRDIYRGVIVWNQNRRIIVNGRRRHVQVPRAEWRRTPAPELRIVSEKQWKAAHDALAASRATCHLRPTGARPGPRRDLPSKYLLVGFAKCGICGGGIHVRVRGRSVPTAYYACTTHYSKGRRWRPGEPSTAPDGGLGERVGLCSHVELWAMDALNQAVMTRVIGEALSPAMTTAVLKVAKRKFLERTNVRTTAPLRVELADLDKQRARLTDAIARTAAQLESLLDRLRAVEARRAEILAILGEEDKAPLSPTWPEVEAQLRQRIADCRAIMTGAQVPRARAMFSELLATPLTLTPFTDEAGYRAVRFEAKIGTQAIFGEVINAQAPSCRLPHYLTIVGVLRSHRAA